MATPTVKDIRGAFLAMCSEATRWDSNVDVDCVNGYWQPLYDDTIIHIPTDELVEFMRVLGIYYEVWDGNSVEDALKVAIKKEFP
jgi:hypothetical protein